MSEEKQKNIRIPKAKNPDQYRTYTKIALTKNPKSMYIQIKVSWVPRTFSRVGPRGDARCEYTEIKARKDLYRAILLKKERFKLIVHYLQHVPYEGLGYIQDWADERGFHLTKTALYKDDIHFPELSEFDLLIVLGGPMNIDQTDEYPWLKQEKEFISRAIHSGKKVLGICMGSQLTATALGAIVSKNAFEEVGWHEVKMRETRIPGLPASFKAMQWHGDTFDLPEDCIWLAESEACSNQAFLYDDRVIGLQFHLEFTEEIVFKVAKSETPSKGQYVQSLEEIAEGRHYFQQSKRLVSCFLDY
ncbi:hypothetical protein AS29_007155 [Bacillus sp. SJS]|nr:hypothetical protein AS29_007155 [Bacillus sp. SJS]